MKRLVFSLLWISIATVVVFGQIPTNGLVAWYPFNGNAIDSSGNGNNGSVNGATLTMDRFGKLLKAYSFDGIDDSMQVPSSSSLEFSATEQFTFSAWIKLQSFAHQAIAFKGGASSPPGYYKEWAVVIEPDQTLRFQVNADSTNSINSYLTSSPSLQLYRWSHVVAMWDGIVGIMKLYLDGQEIGSVAAITQIVSMPSQPLYLGFVGDGAYAGILDDIRIYNRALNSAEIQSLYAEGGYDSSLVAYYPFNGNANDESGNGNNGTVNGAALAPDRFGNANKAYSFNGTNQNITVSSLAFQQSQVTVSLWFLCNQVGPSGNRMLEHDVQNGGCISTAVITGSNVAQASFLVNSERFLQVTSTETTTLGVWTHFVATYDGNAAKIYVDNVLRDSVYNNSGFLSTTATLLIGSSAQWNWNGILDDIRIYNRSLSSSEIDSLYHENGWRATTQALPGEYTTDPNTVLLLHMNEASGSTAGDASGHGNNGTAFGTSIVTGKFGMARQFSTSADSINIPRADLKLPVFTAEAWVYLNSYSRSAELWIISNLHSGVDKGFFLEIDPPSKRLHFTINDHHLFSKSTVTEKTWHHVAATFDGSTMRLFLDGISDTLSSWSDISYESETTYPMKIGNHNFNSWDPSSNSFWDGLIDEVRISNIARSADEIWNYYRSTIDSSTAWKLQLKAFAGSSVDNENYLGAGSTATDGFDASLDIPKPPAPTGNYVQLCFPHPEYNQPTGINFSQDIRANHAIADTVTRWTFEVNTNIPDTLVSLGFISDGRIPSGFGIMLRDLTGGTRQNLKKSGMSYSYNSGGGGNRSFEILIGDSTSPSLTILHPNGGEIIESGSNYSIQWNGSDRAGLDSIQVLYSTNAGTSYNPITTLVGQQTNFSWAVPQIYLDYQGSVAVIATDSMGNTTKQASATVFTIAGDSLSSSFTAGWNLIGTSLKPTDSTVVGNFSDDISQSYYVYDYSPSSGYTRPSTLVDGHGYWLGLLSNQVVDVIGHPVTDSVAVPLAQGFNIVSNPLVIGVPRTALSFAKEGFSAFYQTAIDSGWIANGLTGFNTGAQSYQLADTMEVWNAYWIGALQTGVTLIVRPPMTSTIPLLPAKTPLLNTPSLTDWQLSITAQFGSRTDQPLTLGVKADVTSGFNASYDTPKAPLPPVTSYVETYFLQPTWAPVLGSKFVSDFISPTAPLEWTFYVHTSDSGSVTLSWNSQDVQNMVPKNVVLFLNDQSNSSTVNMKSGSSYTFNNSSLHQFTISGTVTSMQPGEGIPSTFSLNQNYPNPFNPSTTLRYGLPSRSRVRLQIYNLLGQVVADLVNTEQSAGWNQVVWQANVASGLYFYRMEAVSVSDPNKRFVDVKKMILLK